jgi:hypothetical protein
VNVAFSRLFTNREVGVIAAHPHISVRRSCQALGRCRVRRLALHSGNGVGVNLTDPYDRAPQWVLCGGSLRGSHAARGLSPAAEYPCCARSDGCDEYPSGGHEDVGEPLLGSRWIEGVFLAEVHHGQQ